MRSEAAYPTIHAVILGMLVSGGCSNITDVPTAREGDTGTFAVDPALANHGLVIDWQSIGIATGGETCEAPGHDPCPDEQEPPPETLPDGAPFSGNPWGCVGHTEQPHRSGADVSVHGWSECPSIFVPVIRVTTRLEKWALIYWAPHNQQTKSHTESKFVDVNTRSVCSNGKWRGASTHYMRGPDAVDYYAFTANRNAVENC